MHGSIFVITLFAGANPADLYAFVTTQGEKLETCYDLYAVEIFTLRWTLCVSM